MLFGSEFGANGRYGWYGWYGWYGANRYRSSVSRQFRPHRGANSYWFFRAAEQQQPQVDRAAQEIADDIVRRWSS